MNWIKVQTNLRTSPKLVRVASALKWTPVQSMGAVITCWMLADEHASETGLLEGLNFTDIDLMVSCPGLAEAMACVGWLKETAKGVQYVNYEEHNGSTAKSRAREQKRKAVSRKCPPKTGQKPDSKRTREEKKREEKKIPLHNNSNIKDSSNLGEVHLDNEKKRIAEFVNRTAQKLADAYGSRPELISQEAKRNLYIEQKRAHFTDQEVDTAIDYINKHRQGKLGEGEPKIAQEAQSAMSGIGKLIQRGVAYKARITPKKKPCDQQYVPPEPEDITDEEREANLAILRDLTKQITRK
jgi:hypothetical protein